MDAELVGDAVIVASKASAEEMAEVSASMMAQLLENADSLGETGAFFRRCFGAFDFDGITPTHPTRTFEGALDVTVGDKAVELKQVGPAHTEGDILVHVPADRTVFTGDILFIDGTPIMWEGPVANWIRACETIEALDVDVVVPGHGPITDRSGARAVREYLAFVRDEAHRRYEAGMSVAEAAKDIALGRFASWTDTERIAVNVDRLYKEFAGDDTPSDIMTLFTGMAEMASR